MLAKEIMVTDLVCVDENTNIKEIAEKMCDTGVGCVLVLDSSDNLCGIVTDRDIVVRGIVSDSSITDIKASDVMTQNVVTAKSNEDIEDVLDLMSDYQVKRIPILDNNKLVGIISLGDMSQTYLLEDEAGDALNEITEGIHQHK
jgi:CBS domain-containing protein